jgi:hypothetical protein
MGKYKPNLDRYWPNASAPRMFSCFGPWKPEFAARLRAAKRGSSRPAAATLHSTQSHVSVAPAATCTQTNSEGRCVSYWTATDDALDRDQHAQPAHRAPQPGVGLASLEHHPDHHGSETEGEGDRAVDVDRPVQRVRALEVQALDRLPDGAAGMRSGGGRRGAGDQDHRRERRQRAHRPDRPTSEL